jgi:hypothetical protein
MSARTILALVIAVLLTVVIMQNNEPVKFTFLFADIYIPKLVMLTAVSISGFLLGVLVASPRKKKQITDHDHSAGAMDDTHDNRTRPNTLSDEDRDYIN